MQVASYQSMETFRIVLVPILDSIQIIESWLTCPYSWLNSFFNKITNIDFEECKKPDVHVFSWPCW